MHIIADVRSITQDKRTTRCPFDRLEPFGRKRKEVMSAYQFRINQSVRFRHYERMRSSAPGEYEVVGYQPNEDGEPRYRIKSVLEQHERIARESELTVI